MRAFNIALLGKWGRRILVDRRGFWYRVLVAHYGEEVESWRMGAGVVLRGGGRL
jgi:hypothetical protein